MKTDKKINNNTGKLVITATSDIHADLIESLLVSYDIPVVRKYALKAGGMAKIYMGSFNSSVDIFVEEKLFEKAKEILSYQGDDNEDDIVDQVTMKKKKGILNIVLAIIIIISIASAVLIFYVNYLQSAI